jgi:dipeptidase
VWVAQKVPDSHVSVVANSFVIRNVPTRKQAAAEGSNTTPADFDANFLASDNLWSEAEAAGLWSSESEEVQEAKIIGVTV